MTFANNTDFAATSVPLFGPRGDEVVVAIVKLTFVAREGGLVLADEPSPLRANDVPTFPDVVTSSARYPNDLTIEKRGCDVVVVGDAIAPKPVQAMDVAVRVGSKTVPLRVHGERLFYRSVGKIAIGPAATFERMPIVYERAYGGASKDLVAFEPRNPSGVGVAKSQADLVDTRAPQIEHPARPHLSADDAHPPVGFGALMTSWSPRRERAGTFDATWKSTRMPLMPADYDVGFNNVAHPSLVFEDGIAPGVELAVLGMTTSGLLRFVAPKLPFTFRARFDASGRVERAPAADLLLIEPELGRVEVVARTSFLAGRGRDRLREITIEPES